MNRRKKNVPHVFNKDARSATQSRAREKSENCLLGFVTEAARLKGRAVSWGRKAEEKKSRPPLQTNEPNLALNGGKKELQEQEQKQINQEL